MDPVDKEILVEYLTDFLDQIGVTAEQLETMSLEEIEGAVLNHGVTFH